VIPGIIYILVTMGNTISLFIEVTNEGEIKYSSKDFSRTQLDQANYHANKNLKRDLLTT